MDGSNHKGDLDTQMSAEEESPVPETAGTGSEEVSEWPHEMFGPTLNKMYVKAG